MQTTYVHTKLRKEYGREPLFSSRHEIQCSIPADRDYFKQNYVLENPTSKTTQLSQQIAVSEVCTERTEYSHRGILHAEGGWPKDVNYLDEEQPVRYKRRIEKDDAYIQQVGNVTQAMEGIILQNNSVNIYETYFTGLDSVSPSVESHMEQIQAFKDPLVGNRLIKHLSWSPDQGSKISTAYVSKGNESVRDSYIWDVENPTTPLVRFEPHSTIYSLEFNPKDPMILCSGLQSGQVAAWDTRVERTPVSVSPMEVSHRMSCNHVLWINSKTGTEFFSGGSDGQILWWDTRNLNEYLDVLLMDPMKTDEQEISRALGVSVLEYETTIPTKFMTGTENGLLFSCNRKGKTPIEKINFKLQCHFGPIYSLERNPSYLKTFMTVGDWNARIWSEDNRDNPIMWSKNHEAALTGGTWSATRCSLFYISQADGWLYAWDVLVQQDKPLTSVKVCDEAIRSVRSHVNGKVIACGTENGSLYLIRVSDDMTVSDKNDKGRLTAVSRTQHSLSLHAN